MKKLLFSLLILFFLNPAYAVMLDPNSTIDSLFNFQVVASEEGPFPAMYDSVLGNGHQVSATAEFSGIGGVTPIIPWLDGAVAGGSPAANGGLGACQVVPGGCDGDSRDDIEIGESISLLYSGTSIFLGDIHFFSGTHDQVFADGQQFELEVGGVNLGIFDLVPVFMALANTVISDGDSVRISWVAGQGLSNETLGFYVAGFGEVPIPAALPLFLSGLFGFAFFSRKKKVATA